MKRREELHAYLDAEFKRIVLETLDLGHVVTSEADQRELGERVGEVAGTLFRTAILLSRESGASENVLRAAVEYLIVDGYKS